MCDSSLQSSYVRAIQNTSAGLKLSNKPFCKMALSATREQDSRVQLDTSYYSIRGQLNSQLYLSGS